MTSIHLLPTTVLRARLRDLEAARARLDVETERVAAAIRAREPGAPQGRRAAARAAERVRHGTEAGYRAHRKRWGTPPCDRCKTAHAAAAAEYRDQVRRRAVGPMTSDPQPHP